MTRRKEKGIAIPTQFKHLRFAEVDVDAEDIEISNLGGFTLAYRAIQSETDVPGKIAIDVHYAFSECMTTDNFDKKDGRNRTYHRLQGQAPNFTDSFNVNESLPEGWMDRVIVVEGEIVDFPAEFFDLQRAVVEHFLSVWPEYLNVGYAESGDGNLYENLFSRDGVLYINASVLDYIPATFEDLLKDAANTIETIANETIDLLDQTDANDPAAAAAALTAAKKALTDIKELVAVATAPDDNFDEEETDSDSDDSEEGDDEENESEEN